MTEKRFEPIADDDGFVEYIRDTQIGLLTFDEFIDTANALHEKNQDNEAMIEFLSTENSQIRDELQTRTQIQHQLEEENEQLKKDKMILEHNHLPVMERKIKKYKMNVDALTETNDLLNEKIETLSDENEQLKKEIEELKWNLELER